MKATDKIVFTAGKTSTGYDAYFEHNGKIVAVTTGANMKEVKSNALEAYNLFAEGVGISPIVEEDVLIKTK